MNKNRKLRLIMVIGLCLVICLLTVAYATLSKSLNITGTATLKSNTWDVHLENVSCTKTGGASVGSPTVNGTNIQFSEMTLIQPGDTVTCTFNVKNAGSVSAKLSNTVVSTPTYEGIGSTATADVNLVKANCTYTFTYSDGTSIATNNSYATIAAGSSRTMKLYATYKTNNTGIPTNDVLIKNVGLTLTYQQG